MLKMQAVFERKSFPFAVGALVGQLLQFPHEGFHVPEFTVHGGKPYIRNGIPLLQFFHRQLAQLTGGNFPAQTVHQLCLNFISQCFRVHRTFLTGFQQAAQKLVALKTLLGAVFFDDQRLERFHNLICGKPFLTKLTLAAASNAYAVLYRTRINNLAVRCTTNRTFLVRDPLSDSQKRFTIAL